MPSALPRSLPRDTQEAVDFVHRFNGQLGLDEGVLRERNQLTASSAAKFFRVNIALFYHDVLGTYFERSNLLTRKAPEIIIAGDCHLGNFGTMRAADGTTFWGINDFDMAGKGSPEDDLERMATSLLLMSPLSAQSCRQLIEAMANTYLDELQRLAQPGNQSARLAGVTAAEATGRIARLIDKKSKVTQEALLEEFCQNGRLKRNDELKDLNPREQEMLQGFLQRYDQTQGSTPELVRPLQVMDMARKLNSGGSTFGLDRYFLLVQGRDGLPRILDLKQELPTAPEQQSGDPNEARADYIFECMGELGGLFEPSMAATTLEGFAFYMRERQKEKGSLPISGMPGEDDWRNLVHFAAIALARGHANQPGVAQAIVNWVGSDREMLIRRLQDFADVYAEQTRADRAAFAAGLT